MSASASLAPVNVPAAGLLDRPVVLLDGVIEPTLVVERVDRSGPLDARGAVVRVVEPHAQAGEWLIAQARRLIDGRDRWSVLVQGGQLRHVDHDRVELTDAWSQQLVRPMAAVPTVDQDGGIVMQAGGLLAFTRSTQRYDINGREVYVLERDGSPWTVRGALESVAAFANLQLNLLGLPRSIAEAPLVDPIDLSQSLGRVLEAVFEPYGLYLTRRVLLEGHTVIEHMEVRSYSHGRRVRLRWRRADQPLGQVLRVRKRKPRGGSQLWIAEARGPLVESTFELVGGWDPGLEGAPDTDYDRAASSDFAAYANVYRHWVLNEDGAYTGAPFNRGAPYDLAVLFEQAPFVPVPLRFLDCLTLDDRGVGREPIVEVSTDSGATWSRWAGRLRMLSERAGVYLDDATLPAEFLTAAQAGEAAVRVTASLRSPLPVQIMRWRGNPFAGLLPQRRIDLSHRFAFQRVDGGSVHYDDVTAGDLAADQRDDAAAMQRWLVDRMWRDELPLQTRQGEATLTMLGDVAVAPGDQLFEAGGLGADLDEQSQALHRRGGTVVGVRRDYDDAKTTLDLRY